MVASVPKTENKMDELVVKILLSIAAIVGAFIWLYYGIYCNHMFYYAGPLASAGYVGWADNLFKCAALFLALNCIWVVGGMDLETKSAWCVGVLVSLFGIFVIRELTCWRS